MFCFLDVKSTYKNFIEITEVEFYSGGPRLCPDNKPFIHLVPYNYFEESRNNRWLPSIDKDKLFKYYLLMAPIIYIRSHSQRI